MTGDPATSLAPGDGTENPGAAAARVSTEDPGGTISDDGDRPQQVALILQRHLLPTGLPIFPQFRLAARHLVAAGAPGGGCFDAFTLAGGTIALMVGHACGHGPEAVAATSQLRTVLRRALHAGAGLPETLSRMDEFAAAIPAGRGASAVLVLLDPATGSLHYASAGHPMPLVCAPTGDAGGTVSLLPPTGDKPLGLGNGRPTVATTQLAPGAVLLLGGDRPGGTPDGDGGPGTERLAAAAGAALAGAIAAGAKPAADAADLMCAAVAERLAGGRLDGDVTVLAAHRLPEPDGGLTLRLPAEAPALRQLRGRLAEWLAEIGASPMDRVDAELAVYEAAANAIVHGRPADGPGMVTVEVGLDRTGEALIQVTDQGQWRQRTAAVSEDRPGGRGLAVISKVTSELRITPSPRGTTVIMRRPLAHPSTVDQAPAG